jgi:prophage regulatory protein
MEKHATPDTFNPSRDEIYSPRQLTHYTTLSLATLWRMRRRGELPEPIRLSPGRVGWRRSDIDRWLASRDAAGR